MKQLDFNSMLCLLVIQVSQNGICSDLTILPDVKITYPSLARQEIFFENQSVIYSELGIELNITCEASYPIQWNFQGFVSPPEMIEFEAPLRNLRKNRFRLRAHTFLINVAAYPELGASFQIFCEKIGNPEITTLPTSVFVRGTSSNVFVIPKSSNVTDATIIECPTKDPTMTPLLYQRNATNGNEILIQDPLLVYEPTKGFSYINRQIFDGIYTCRVNHSSVTITALTSQEYHVSPTSSVVRVFTDSLIKLECLSKSAPEFPIYFTFNNLSNTLKVLYNPSTFGQIATVSPSLANLGNKDKYILKTNAICWTGSSEQPVIIKEWSLEFVPPPVLHLDNFYGTITCLSDLSPKILQIVNCTNPVQCRYMSRCLDDPRSCNLHRKNQFFTGKDTVCQNKNQTRLVPCVRMGTLSFSGLIQCSVHGLIKRWEFFVSLDFLKYSNLREPPTNEILRMDEIPSVLYTNETTKFTCVAVQFVAKFVYFEMELKNGTQVLLQDYMDSVKITIAGSQNRRRIFQLNTIGILDVKLPKDAVSISCIAPWWNSTDVLKTERRFETRDLQIPRFKDGDDEYLKTETFYFGQTYGRLTCCAMGEPKPIYEWYFKDVNVKKVFPKLKMYLGADGGSYLEFPEIQKRSRKFIGEWKCRAKNKLGRVERIFILDVRGEPTSGKTWGYRFTLGGVSLIMIGLVLVVWRRYKQAKERLRDLTEAEIEEFFKGKPEFLLANRQKTGRDIVDFLPYKDEYEIPLDDLEFDSSDEHVLGSGFFSYVVRGTIVSRQQPVAIKISKPSADVNLFKSLLSEIKIMIYIGDHENVVKLIGVCTEGIRNRSIHIATEICDLGSLDTLLRDSRATFLNLINENQQIDCRLLFTQHVENDRLNTIDLISFCQQIASGMEYITHKSIIHADLAARNVLVTGNKVCKISDFGLSKKLYESNTYVKKSQTPLPWRWMALESLKTLTFSTSSDVWAFGVTMFEIFSLGDIPFPNETWNNDFLSRLASGMRMGRPKYITQEIYAKVMSCWETEPKFRPDFSILRAYFQLLLTKLLNDRPAGLRQTYLSNLDPCRQMNQSSVMLE